MSPNEMAAVKRSPELITTKFNLKILFLNTYLSSIFKFAESLEFLLAIFYMISLKVFIDFDDSYTWNIEFDVRTSVKASVGK